jgi:methylmalonyl-CoA mutase N-terminal domain/subunit
LDILRISGDVEKTQRRRIQKLREGRDEAAVEAALAALVEAAGGDGNLMPLIVEAGRKRATEGEIAGALKGVFGGYREPPRV